MFLSKIETLLSAHTTLIHLSVSCVRMLNTLLTQVIGCMPFVADCTIVTGRVIHHADCILADITVVPMPKSVYLTDCLLTVTILCKIFYLVSFLSFLFMIQDGDRLTSSSMMYIDSTFSERKLLKGTINIMLGIFVFLFQVFWNTEGFVEVA